MRKLCKDIIYTEISVYDAEKKDLLGIETNEWMKVYIRLDTIVSLRKWETDDPELNGLPFVTLTDGRGYLLNELFEDFLNDWINYNNNGKEGAKNMG